MYAMDFFQRKKTTFQRVLIMLVESSSTCLFDGNYMPDHAHRIHRMLPVSWGRVGSILKLTYGPATCQVDKAATYWGG